MDHDADSNNANVLQQVTSTMISNAVLVRAHRWSAAFPSTTRPFKEVFDAKCYLNGKNQAYVDEALQFAACGDYLVQEGEGFGKMEGAAVSGMAAAEVIAQQLSTKSE